MRHGLVYTTGVADRLSALGLPQTVSGLAEDSVMAGVEVARQAPATVADPIRIAVQEVFVDGLHGAVWVAVAITSAAALAALILLRGAPRGHRAVAMGGRDRLLRLDAAFGCITA